MSKLRATTCAALAAGALLHPAGAQAGPVDCSTAATCLTFTCPQELGDCLCFEAWAPPFVAFVQCVLEEGGSTATSE